MRLALELPPAEVATFTADQLAYAAAAWPLRAAEELRSALIYRALAAACATALPDFAERFARVMTEELGHARLCTVVGARLGAAAPRHDTRPVTHRLAPLATAHARAIALAVGEVAIGETISLAMFREGRRHTTEPLSLAAIESITADEARHQQLGWDAVAALGASDHMRAEALLALRAAEQQIAVPALRFLEAGRAFDPAWAGLGVIPPERRVEAFYAAVEGLVLPRLDRAGLDGSGAWASRYRHA